MQSKGKATRQELKLVQVFGDQRMFWMDLPSIT